MSTVEDAKSTTLATSPTVQRGHNTARWVLTAISIIFGILLATVWSYQLVDSVIGDNVANTILGYDAKEATIGSAIGGVVFAFVSGLAGTFTACNVAVFGALPQVTGTPGAASVDRRAGLRGTFRAMGWLVLGMLVVSTMYGVVAILVGSRLPQLSTRVLSSGMPERLLQSMVVFGVIGLAFTYLGLASLGVVRDPLAKRHRWRLVILGALIGGFLVGRPYPLFYKLLEYAITNTNVASAALVMALQSLGNVLVVVILATLLVGLARLAPPGWFTQQKLAKVSGVTLLVLGTFLIFYWDVRLPSMFGVGWFPRMPWN